MIFSILLLLLSNYYAKKDVPNFGQMITYVLLSTWVCTFRYIAVSYFFVQKSFLFSFFGTKCLYKQLLILINLYRGVGKPQKMCFWDMSLHL